MDTLQGFGGEEVEVHLEGYRLEGEVGGCESGADGPRGFGGVR